MTRKRKRRSSVVEIGTGPCRVKIYTVNRKDGYSMFSLNWKEDEQQKFRKPRLSGRGPLDRASDHRHARVSQDFNECLGGCGLDRVHEPYAACQSNRPTP